MKRKLLWTAALVAVLALFCTGCGSPVDDHTPVTDTEAAFNNLAADGSVSATTTFLTLTFDKDITGLAAADITITPNSTGAAKGDLTRTGTGIYRLAVSSITAAGQITVTVSKSGYNINPASKSVDVFYYYDPSDIAVSFTALSADGSAGEATTTALTLTFDKDITGLAAADITITPNSTGAVKGALTRVGTGTYQLAVTGITKSGQISVTVSKSGYNITPASQNVYIYYYDPSAVSAAFSGLSANGSAGEATTTALTLTFDKDITGLTAADITITPNSTGAVKGDLTPISTGVYQLAVTGITASGQISVSVVKSGYNITPANQNVNVFYYYNELPGIGVGIGNSSVKLYLNDNAIPLEEGGTSGSHAGAGTFTVSIAAGTYDKITWYLNGELLPEASMKQSIVLSRQRAGTYLITVEARTGGKKNTGSHTFVVGE